MPTYAAYGVDDSPNPNRLRATHVPIAFLVAAAAAAAAAAAGTGTELTDDANRSMSCRNRQVASTTSLSLTRYTYTSLIIVIEMHFSSLIGMLRTCWLIVVCVCGGAGGGRRPPWLGCVFERNIYVGTLCNQRTLCLLYVLLDVSSRTTIFVPWVPSYVYGINSFMVS